MMSILLFLYHLSQATPKQVRLCHTLVVFVKCAGVLVQGKRGGVRVIYFNMLEDAKIWLLLIYGKNVKENIPAHIFKRVKEELES